MTSFIVVQSTISVNENKSKLQVALQYPDHPKFKKIKDIRYDDITTRDPGRKITFSPGKQLHFNNIVREQIGQTIFGIP